MYTLYWIHSSDQKDPLSEGYVGITSQSLEKRFKDHKFNNKNLHLKNRCRKGGVNIVSLYENLTYDEAREKEKQYRPQKNIGWNIATGGDVPPSRKGITCQDNDKSKLRGEQRTEAQKLGDKKRSKTITGNSFRKGWRKSDPKSITIFCKECGSPRKTWNKEAKFCSRKCAGSTNKDPQKRALLAEKTSFVWKDAEYKKRVSENIKKALKQKKDACEQNV